MKTASERLAVFCREADVQTAYRGREASFPARHGRLHIIMAKVPDGTSMITTPDNHAIDGCGEGDAGGATPCPRSAECAPV